MQNAECRMQNANFFRSKLSKFSINFSNYLIISQNTPPENSGKVLCLQSLYYYCKCRMFSAKIKQNRPKSVDEKRQLEANLKLFSLKFLNFLHSPNFLLGLISHLYSNSILQSESDLMRANDSTLIPSLRR